MAREEHRLVEASPYPSLGSDGVRTVQPQLPSMRETLEGLFKNRLRIIKAMAITMALFLILALLVPARYAARVWLLVSSGTEYTVRPEAGQPSGVNQVALREEILATEVDILESPALHEAVIRKIGLDRLYPGYSHPSRWQLFKRSVSDSVRAVEGTFMKAPAARMPTPDPVRIADQYEFVPNLGITPQKIGSVIELSFSHRDPELAALTLNTLVAEYLVYRHRLYEDVQTPRVLQQLSEVKAQLEESDRKLSAFKDANGIANFSTQMDILLRREGQLAADQQDADNLARQLKRRLDDVRIQLAVTPEHVTEFSDLDTQTIQANLDKLRAREIEMRDHYLPESAPLVELRAQIASGEAELAKLQSGRTPGTVRTGRNRTFDAVDLDRSKSEADLNAASARLGRDNQQLAEVQAQVERLNKNQTELESLQRERAAEEDVFRSLSKTYADQKLLEDVNSRQITSVRAVADAEVPLASTGRRTLLFMTGLIASLMVGVAVATIYGRARRGYLSPEAVERSMGVLVLATIGESNSTVPAVRTS